MFEIMQADSMLSSSSSYNCCDSKNQCSEMSDKVSEEFMAKLKIGESDTGYEDLTGEMRQQNNGKIGDLEVYEEVDEEEFSFTCMKPDGSPISAEDVFQDGQIRPIFPIFNRDLLFGEEDNGDSSSRGKEASSPRPPLKKIFFEEQNHHRSSSASESDQLEEAPNGPYCEWSGKKAVDASPQLCKKSNSTGFSKLWRFRDMVTRSNSDGKDVFVFLNPNSTNTRPSNDAAKKIPKVEKIVKTEEKKSQGQQTTVKVKAKGKKGETSSSAHEKLYIKNRAKKEENKRKTYLPYRVGFFTNVNGLSRNVNPF